MNLFALLWGIAIVLSLTGWGWAVSYFFRINKEAHWGMKAALGVAFSAVFGGLMNLFLLISSRTILVYLGLGLVLLLFFIILNFHETIGGVVQGWRELARDKIFACLAVGILLLFIFQYAVATFSSFNPSDDYQAYFVFPAKMIQTGHLGDDPFSERRMATSFGGQSFLDTFVLAALPFDYLHLVDRGVSWLILILLVWGLFRKYNFSPRTAALAVGSLMLFPLPLVNITGQITAIVLFIVLLELTFFKEPTESEPIWHRAALLAMVAAALCSLKFTAITACVFYFIFYYIILYKESATKKERLTTIKLFIFSSFLVFVALLPWMLSMYHSSGTLLYPVFGKGFYGTAYDSAMSPYSELSYANALNLLYQLANVLFVVLFLFILWFWRSVPSDEKLRQRLKFFLWATVLGVTVCAFMLAGLGVYRYVFPFIVAAIILLLANFVGKSSSFQGRLTSWKYEQIALLVVAIIFGAGMLDFFNGIKGNLKIVYGRLLGNQTSSFNDFFDDIQSSGGSSTFTAREKSGYQKMQEATPAGEILLARLEKPFLLDFTRNPVYIIDLPGGASLPPGLPYFKGSEALAEYLLSKNIRYVAYSYSTECLFPRSELLLNTLKSTTNVWQRTEIKDTLNLHDSLKELGETRKRIYDDGVNFVLDLSSKVK